MILVDNSFYFFKEKLEKEYTLADKIAQPETKTITSDKTFPSWTTYDGNLSNRKSQSLIKLYLRKEKLSYQNLTVTKNFEQDSQKFLAMTWDNDTIE